MGIIFDEVVADVSRPARHTQEDMELKNQASSRNESWNIQRDVLLSIERSKHRKLRLEAD